MTNPKPEDLAARIVQGDTQQDVTELIKEATPAGPDTEETLASLARVQGARGRWNKTGDLYEVYTRLRDQATDALVDGPRYFIDADGVKRYAVRLQAEPVEVDEELLAQEVSPAVLAEVAPRKVDKDLFKRAVAAGRIKPATLLKVAKVKPSAPYVKFYTADASD